MALANWQELKAKASGNTHIEPGKRKNGLTINFRLRDTKSKHTNNRRVSATRSVMLSKMDKALDSSLFWKTKIFFQNHKKFSICKKAR
jgi:hypothetical protein